MPKTVIKNNIILAMLFATALVSLVLFYKQNKQADTVDIAHFPMTIGPWQGVELPISKEDLSILETENAFARKYTNSIDKSEVYLYTVYSQNNRKVAHPPEICYTGSGITILENVHDPIQVSYKNMNIATNRLRLNKGDFDHFSYYWFKVGDQFTSNYWHQQFLIALYSLTGKKSSSALVRVSADIKNGDTQKAIANIKAFTDQITSHLFLYLP